MWLPKTERLALGDSEKEITAYPEAARVPTDANEVFRIESVRYRASAYVGRVADLQSCTQPISTFTGNGSILFLRPVPDDPLLRTMITTRLLLAQKIERVESVNQIPVVPPFMAVTLECLSQADDGAVEQMARFDLTFDGPDARASLAIANQPEMTIGPIRVRKRGGLWNVMVRMLPDWGDEGLMSCWHPA
jgi:hypothetical protein